MKRAEAWLSDRPWFIWGLRLAILWPLFLLWVLPTWAPLREGMRKEAEYQRHRDIHVEAQKSREFNQKANELLAEAKKSGLDYGPKQYFRDLRYLESRSGKDHISLALANGQVGIGTVLRTNCCSKIAARTKIAENTTLYLSLAESGVESPRWGIGHKVGKVRLDLASNGDTVWFRATEPVGRFYPELRTKFTNGETFVGFGLGFAQ